MRLFGVEFRRTQFVPSGLDVAIPGGLVRGSIYAKHEHAGLPVVYACLNVLTQRLTAMPVRILDDARGEMPTPQWLRQPSPGVTTADLVSQIAVSLVQHGNAYLLPVRVNREVVEVYCAPHDAVNVRSTGDGAVDYVVHGQIYDDEIIHARYVAVAGRPLGLSAWEAAERALAIGVSSQEFVDRHFNQSAHLQMAILAKGQMTAPAKRELAAQIRARHMGDPKKAWQPLVLDSDTDVRSLSMTTEQAKFVELMNLTNAQIASMIFRVDPSLVGIAQAGSSLTYSNLVDREAQLYRDAIHPLAVRIEQALSRLLPEGATVDLDARETLRGSPRDRADLATKMKAMGTFTANEIREVLGYPALTDDDVCVGASPTAIVIGDAPPPQEMNPVSPDADG